MSEGQIGSECSVAAGVLEKKGLTRAAAVLRKMAAEIYMVEVPLGGACVLEVPITIMLHGPCEAEDEHTG